MTLYLLVALVVVAAVVGWLVLRRRFVSDPPIRRDAPTFEQAAVTRPRLGVRLGGLFGRPVDQMFWDALEEAFAGYASTGLYRPMTDCIMFTKGTREFCVVCREAMVGIIDWYSR